MARVVEGFVRLLVFEDPLVGNVTVREDGGMLSLEQDGDLVQIDPADMPALRAALLDAVTE